MIEYVFFFLISFAVIVFVISLISHRLEGTPITAPMIFVAAGMLLCITFFDWTNPIPQNTFLLLIAQIALVLTLFSDASRLNFQALRKGAMLPIRLLVIGLPITVLLGGLIAIGFFPALTLAEAALIGVILAPTDAGLGQAIVNSPLIPVRIRQAMNVESGLNDGGCLPFFYVFLFMASASLFESSSETWAQLAIELIGLGIIVGIIVGFIGIWLIDTATRKGYMIEKYQWIGFFALPIIAWIAAETIGGSGFIAAFVGGLTVAASGRNIESAVITFTEAGGEMLNLAVFFIFGLAAVSFLPGITGMVILYALLSLTIIRMLPVAISLIGTKLHHSTVLLIGWFGPRGLASVVLLLIVMEEAATIPGIQTVQTVIILTVLLSVFAHGLSASPLLKRYAKFIELLPSHAAENQELEEEHIRSKKRE